MTDATITLEEVQGGEAGKTTKIAHISGQLDESNVDEKIKELYKATEDTPSGLNLILDLEKLEYMNSKSIGYLTDIYGKISENGGKVVISGAKANILDILQVVGLTQLIQNFASIEEAKLKLGAPAEPTEQAVEAAPTVVPETPVAPEAPTVVPETPVAPEAPVVEAPTPTAAPEEPPQA